MAHGARASRTVPYGLEAGAMVVLLGASESVCGSDAGGGEGE